MGDTLQGKITYKDEIWELQKEIAKMPDMLEAEEKKFLSDAGKILARNVRRNLRGIRSARVDKNHKHMADDVKYTVKKSRNSGDLYLSVRGGKMTGYKWHLLNDGTRNPDGSIHTPATHFIDETMRQSEAEINALIDSYIGKVIGE